MKVGLAVILTATIFAPLAVPAVANPTFVCTGIAAFYGGGHGFNSYGAFYFGPKTNQWFSCSVTCKMSHRNRVVAAFTCSGLVPGLTGNSDYGISNLFCAFPQRKVNKDVESDPSEGRRQRCVEVKSPFQ